MKIVERLYTTVIPADNEHNKNEYVHGRINAVLKIYCCRPNMMVHMGWLDNGDFLFKVYTNNLMYRLASKCIEDWYPGMCKFDEYDDEEE